MKETVGTWESRHRGPAFPPSDEVLSPHRDSSKDYRKRGGLMEFGKFAPISGKEVLLSLIAVWAEEGRERAFQQGI